MNNTMINFKGVYNVNNLAILVQNMKAAKAVMKPDNQTANTVYVKMDIMMMAKIKNVYYVIILVKLVINLNVCRVINQDIQMKKYVYVKMDILMMEKIKLVLYLISKY